MNSFDIIPPDFKLTGKWTFSTSATNKKEIYITKQRRLITQANINKINRNSPLTPSMQLNKPEEYWTTFQKEVLDKIPNAQRELFIAALGRKDYMDEVLLCLALNVGDESNITQTPSIFTKYLEWLKLFYDRLSNIVTMIMKLTAGTKGPRRRIYQHYFYLQIEPKAGDAILNTLAGIKITSLLEYRDPKNSEFRTSITQLQKDLIALYNAEDIPVLDLIDLTLDQFNTILKLLPKENAWLKARKARLKFFNVVTSDLDKLMDVVDKFSVVYDKYVELLQKRDNPGTKLEELQILSEMQTKDIINIIPQKINNMTIALNIFTFTYNSSGVLKYRGKTLTQQASLVNDLLNSQFITFLQTFKNQHKNMLTNSIDSKLNSNIPKLVEILNFVKTFATSVDDLNVFNTILMLLAIYKNVRLIKDILNDRNGDRGGINTAIAQINKIVSELSSAFKAGIENITSDFIQNVNISTVDTFLQILAEEVKTTQEKLSTFNEQTVYKAKELFEFLNNLKDIDIVNNRRIIDTLTVLVALLPVQYVDELPFSNTKDIFNIYK